MNRASKRPRKRAGNRAAVTVVPSLLRTTKAQVLAAAVAGVLGWAVTGTVMDNALGVMVGITLGEVVFLTLSTSTLWPMAPQETASAATREDLAPFADEVLVVLASVLAMVSVVTLHLGTGEDGSGHSAQAVMTLVGVFGAWACVHQTYAVHYAHLYYVDEDGGIDFGPGGAPSYVDFLYLSYAVGMTYGVTDSTVTSRDIRKVVLRHGLVSFVFGLVILGAAINLVTGMFGLG